MPVPLFDNVTPLVPLRERLRARMSEVLERGVYILGPEVQAFEERFASYLGVRSVIGVANGTEAITIALRALDVGAGDDVVVPSFTFYASAEAIPPTGAKPVFCDVDPATFCVTADTVRAALTPRTKAVVAVDLFGNPAPIPEIRALGVPVIEDAAQAAGAALNGCAAGSLGDLATFSFYPSKNLGAFGDGGAIATNDDELADRVRMLRLHGSRDRQTFVEIGYNSRLDELQAALLQVLLPELDRWTSGRRAAADLYEERGLGQLLAVPKTAPGGHPAWHLYVVRHPQIDGVARALAQRAIGHRAYYRRPVHRQPAMQHYVDGLTLPATDELARTHLAIPMSPVLGREQVDAVVAAVRRAEL